MSLCLDTYVIRDPNCVGYCCKGGNLEDKIDIAIEAGYRAVELWHPDIVKFKDAGGSLSGLRAKMTAAGVRIPSMKVIQNTFTANDHERAMSEYHPMLMDAFHLGVESVVVKIVNDQHRGPVPDRKEMAKRYLRLIEFCMNCGVKASLEFMSLAPHYNSLEKAVELVKDVGHPDGRLVLDTFHLWRNGDANFDSFARSVEAAGLKGDMVSVVHFTDASKTVPQHKQTDGDRKMPGDGLLNLQRFATILGGIGFGGFVSLNVYDKSLWSKNLLEVATDGLYRMNRIMFNDQFQHTADSDDWRRRQTVRCDGLWSKDYFSHLDPRYVTTNRGEQLEKVVGPLLEGKSVLDFKCGFSPLSKYVTIGFDAYQGCVDYLRLKHPAARWVCASDEDFAKQFHEKIDVLLHIGLGDSDTEVDTSLAVRRNCDPDLVILECCANDDGTVNDAKAGSSARWEKLKAGLVGETHVIKTDMPKRSTRLLFVGRKNDNR